MYEVYVVDDYLSEYIQLSFMSIFRAWPVPLNNLVIGFGEVLLCMQDERGLCKFLGGGMFVACDKSLNSVLGGVYLRYKVDFLQDRRLYGRTLWRRKSNKDITDLFESAQCAFWMGSWRS